MLPSHLEALCIHQVIPSFHTATEWFMCITSIWVNGNSLLKGWLSVCVEMRIMKVFVLIHVSAEERAFLSHTWRTDKGTIYYKIKLHWIEVKIDSSRTRHACAAAVLAQHGYIWLIYCQHDAAIEVQTVDKNVMQCPRGNLQWHQWFCAYLCQVVLTRAF